MNEIPKNIKKYISALEGISYFDWMKLQRTIDSYFEAKRHAAERGFSIVPEEVTYYPF